jgi:hypothetical protein
MVGMVCVIGALAADAPARTDPGTRCAASKVRATRMKIAAKLACHERALTRSGSVDQACLAKAEAAFARAFARAEARGGCATTGDVGAMEAKVDSFIADVVSELPATTSTTTTTLTCGFRAIVNARIGRS